MNPTAAHGRLPGSKAEDHAGMHRPDGDPDG
jgi:hypothetical protein